jgi:hypothetical protein
MSNSLPINNSPAVSRSLSLASTDSDRSAYFGLLKDISSNSNFFGSSLPPSRSNSGVSRSNSGVSRSNSGVSRSNSGVSRSVSTDSDRAAYFGLLNYISDNPTFLGSSFAPSRNNSRDLSQSNSHMMSTRSVSDMSLGVIWYDSTESIPVFQSNTIIQNDNNTKSVKKTSNGKIVGKASCVSKKGKKNPKLSEHSKTRPRINGRFIRITKL